MNPEISRAISPTNPKSHGEISDRARKLIVENFDIRGRFTRLEELSGINSAQWRNFYYEKQRINEKMLAFVFESFPNAKAWILTGKDSPEQSKGSVASESDLPFGIPVPKKDEYKTIGQRLSWVIRRWFGKTGPDLLNFLYEKSINQGKMISIEDWAKVIQGAEEPSADMLSIVCERNHAFALWILIGSFEHTRFTFTPFSSNDQIDPSNPVCVADYRHWDEIECSELEAMGFPNQYKFESPKLNNKPNTAKKRGNKKG